MRLMTITIIGAALALTVLFFFDQDAGRKAELEAQQACIASGGFWVVYGVTHLRPSCVKPDIIPLPSRDGLTATHPTVNLEAPHQN